jgi:hypothetical protein
MTGILKTIHRCGPGTGRRDPLRRRPVPTGITIPVLAAACLLSGTFRASAVPQALPEGAEIRIQANPETATVGDPIRIDLDITLPRGFRAEIPNPGRQARDFEISGFLPGTDVTETGPEKNAPEPSGSPASPAQHHRARIIAAVFKTGAFDFPGLKIYLTDPGGKVTEFESPRVRVEIRSVLDDKDRALRDLKKQAEIDEPFRWLFWSLIALAVCILGAAAWFAWRRYRRRPDAPPPEPRVDPLEQAEADLKALVARNLPENGRTKQLYILLSEIVKRVLEAGFGIQAIERTTGEIMDSLRRDSLPGTQSPDWIEALLVRCDMVKFAKYMPSKAENDHAVESAFAILAAARQSRTVDSALHEDPAKTHRGDASSAEDRRV